MKDDYLIRVLSDDGTLRAVAAQTTGLVADLQRRHATDPVATIALGRLATGTALLGAQLKGKQRLALMVEGNGPLQRLQAETDAGGAIRATIRCPRSGPPPEDGGSAVARAVGRAGFLHVIRDLGMKEPYRSMVQLQTSEIGEDLAYYLTSSEQVPSAVSLAVRLDRNADVAAAGGFLIQALPGCPDGRLEQLEQSLAALPPLSEMLADGKTPEQVLALVLAGIDHHEVGRHRLRFECRCNLRRIVEMLRSLPEEERRELAGREETTTVTCEYCRKSYSFTPDELAALDS